MARAVQTTSRNVEVLLVHDVDNLGQRGEIVRVKPGFARNFLLPQGKATVATLQNKRMVEKHKERLAAIEAGRVKQLQRIADAVSKYSATIEAHATADNHLYGSVVAQRHQRSTKGCRTSGRCGTRSPRRADQRAGHVHCETQVPRKGTE